MSLTIQYESLGPRSAFRATLPGLMIGLPTGQQIQLKDLSAGGLSFELPRAESVLVPGSVVRANLLIADNLYLEGLPCRIVRIAANNLVAAAFDNLSLQQEARIDKLVLEIQKRLIAQRKMQTPDPENEAAIPAPQGADSAHTILLDDPNLE